MRKQWMLWLALGIPVLPANAAMYPLESDAVSQDVVEEAAPEAPEIAVDEVTSS